MTLNDLAAEWPQWCVWTSRHGEMFAATRCLTWQQRLHGMEPTIITDDLETLAAKVGQQRKLEERCPI